MNLTEWILASAVVLLWLRLEVMFHKHDVLRTEHNEACANGDRRLREMRRDTLSWLEFDAFSQRIRDRLDKLDPPRRRATDQVDDCGGPECSLCGNLTVCKKHDRLFAGISKQTLRDHIHGPDWTITAKPKKKAAKR